MIRRARTAVDLVAAVLLVQAVAARADDQDVIDYRQHSMKTMQEQVDAIEMILKKQAPAENLGIHIKVLEIAARTAKGAFQPKVEGGRAKADVWTHWSDFSHRLDELVVSLKDLEKTSTSGGLPAETKVQAALTCMSCHDVYRAPAK